MGLACRLGSGPVAARRGIAPPRLASRLALDLTGPACGLDLQRWCKWFRGSDEANVLGLLALATGHDVELDRLALLEGLEA